MNDVKPGWASSEFYTTILTLVGSLLVTLFGVPKAEADNLVQAFLGAVVAVSSLLASGLVVWNYIIKRTELKLQAMKNEVQIKALQRGG